MTKQYPSGAALLRVTITLLVATAGPAMRAAAQEATIDDTTWASMDTRTLNSLPSAFVLRPTHFRAAGDGMAGGMAKAGNKMLGRAISFDMLMGLAYDADIGRVISPADKPSGRFDLLMTTPDASKEKLQTEIERTLGYTARAETRPTDVLVLKVVQAGAPGLKPGQGGHTGKAFAGSSAFGGSGAGGRSRQISLKNQRIANLVRNLQGYFDKPLVDRTGLTGTYDVSLEIAAGSGVTESEAIAQALSTQLGLALTPSNESVELLVVQKAK